MSESQLFSEDDIEQVLKEANALMQIMRYDAAEELLRPYIYLTDNLRILRAYSSSAMLGNKKENALSVLLQLYEIDTEMRVHTTVNLALALRRMGKSNDAIRLLEHALSDYPKERVVLSELGMSFFYIGEEVKAEGYIVQSLEGIRHSDCNWKEVMCNAAEFQIELGSYNDVIEKMKQVLRKYPIYSRALWLMADALFEKEQYSEAKYWFEKCDTYDPEDSPIGYAKERIRECENRLRL